MTYVDTNVVLWLAGGARDQLSKKAENIVNTEEQLLISPMVELEIEYLYEVGHINHNATSVLSHLQGIFPIAVCARSFDLIVKKAKQIKWTRDPFDRIVTAQAAVSDNPLLTRDKIIRANYAHAIW